MCIDDNSNKQEYSREITSVYKDKTNETSDDYQNGFIGDMNKLRSNSLSNPTHAFANDLVNNYYKYHHPKVKDQLLHQYWGECETELNQTYAGVQLLVIQFFFFNHFFFSIFPLLFLFVRCMTTIEHQTKGSFVMFLD